MQNQDAQVEFEEPPGHGRLPHPWEDVPLAQWNDWRWQLTRHLNTVEDFVQVIRLTPERAEGFSAPGLFLVDAVLGQFGQTCENGSNEHQPELQILVLLNTGGGR